MMLTPGIPLHLTKFDVAERQLNQAISLFFGCGDPISIHTLAEAAAQVLHDLKDKFGTTSFIRDSDLICDDYKKQWLAAVFKSRNFFKHADRDGDATHEFKEELNHFSLADAVNMYLFVKKGLTPETLLFLAWFSSAHPSMVKKDPVFSELVERFRSGPDAIPTGDLSSFAQCLSALRAGRLVIPGVVLQSGLLK